MIELRGLATTVLGIVRMHMEKSLPPRGLYVPFQLGRPVGEPGDAAFQRRVVMSALGLLERTDGPFILEDFPDQAPSWSDRAGWRPPFALPSPRLPGLGEEWSAALASEISLLAPHNAAFKQRFGRSTVGTSRMAPETWPAFMSEFLEGQIADAGNGFAPALALRYVVDDLKAYCYEAAQAQGEQPAARQVDTWFWRETTAGLAMQALRVASQASAHNAFKTVGGRFFVPVPYIAPLPA